MLEPGQLVDHYKVRGLVGRGGMGAVYLARDTRLGRKVALKVIHPERVGPETVRAFLEEARVTARFNHPHIVVVYGAGEIDGSPYLALEYLEGGTLRAQLDQARLPVGRATRVAYAIAQALAEAHDAGVLHRDLKPENVFLPRDGRVRVVDFGLARAVSAEAVVDGEVEALQTQLAGTPLYMAPELWTRRETSSAADIWAFGLCLYEMLAGQHPFADAEGNVARLKQALIDGTVEPAPLPEPDAVPTELLELLTACLARDPADRPTARVVVARLDGILHGRAEEDSEEPPFRGLLPFGEQHAGQFYGREAELALFLERLNGEATLPVVGPSGSGKSSFVFAGVVPRLREQAFWLVVQLRPGRSPFETLAARLADKGSQSSARISGVQATMDQGFDETGELPAQFRGATTRRSPAELAARLRAAPGSLHLVLREIAEEQRCHVLLVVDQLEELFALVDDEQERRDFVTALCSAADDPEDPIRVLLTVRDDFLGRLAETPAAAEALGRVALIRPLGREALRETLVRPLQTRGYTADEPTLFDEMVDEVADSPAGLPLLQFCARMLWDRRDRQQRVIRRRDHDALGGVGGALARHAEEVLAGLGADKQEVARQLLLRLLSADGTRRVVGWDELIDGLPPGTEATLERLVGARLVVVQEGSGPRQVELAHESLVRNWARLRRWHAESREEVRLLAELEDAARLWERRGNRLSELWSGETLLDAERVLGATEVPLSARGRGFLDAARAARDRATRNRRWLITGAVGLLAAIAVISTLASVAYARQRATAVALADRAQQARAEALAAGAQAAYASGDTLAARAQLRSALAVRDAPAARALWWRLDDDVVVWRTDTPYHVLGHALAPDAAEVLVAASDGILRKVDLRTGRAAAYRTPAARSQLSTAAVSPDGRSVAAADFDGGVWVWSDGGDARRLEGLPRDVYPYEMGWLSDGRLGLYVYWPNGFATALFAWPPEGGPPSRVDGAVGHGRAELSPDGRALVSGNPRGGEVRWLEVGGEGRTVGTLGPDDRVGRFAWHPDGRVAAVGRNVVVFDAARGEVARFPGHPEAVRAAGWLADGSLAAVGADGSIRVWDARGAPIREVRVPFDGDPKIRGGTVSSTGQVLIARESGLVLVDLNRPGRRGADRGHVGFVEGVAVDPKLRWFASGGQDGRVRIWEAGTGAQLAVLTQAAGVVTDLRFDPVGDWLIGASSSGNVVIWSTRDWRVLKILDHPADAKAAIPDPSGSWLLTADYAGNLRRWDLTGLRAQGPVADVPVDWHRHLDTNVFDLALSGDRFAAADYYGKIAVGTVGSDAPARVIDAHDAQVHSVLAWPDGTLISLGFDDALRAWDPATGQRLLEAKVPGATGIGAVPDGARVLRGDDRGVVAHTLATGDVTAVIGPWSGPAGVAFDPTGRLALIGDGVGTLWPVDLDGGGLLWSTILVDEERVLTHRGWTPDAPEGAWARTALERGRFGSVEGDTICLVDRDGVLSLWDRVRDEVIASWPASGAREVVAQERRCAVRVDGAIHRYAADDTTVLQGRWTRLVDQPGGAAVGLEEGRVVLLPADGGPPKELAVVGASAARVDGEALWVGTTDGALMKVEDPWGARRIGRPPWVRPPASQVVAIEPGPSGTVVSAHEDGELVLWDVASGAHLVDRKLHGPPQHLRSVSGGLVAATAVGDVERVDLRGFTAPRCDLLRAVEGVVPTVWAGDRIVLAEGPTPCDEAP